MLEEVGAGDGARTRDSLLGRQDVAKSPLAWYRSAVGADRTGISKIDAALTKTFAFPWHKISRTFPMLSQSPRHKISRISSGRRLLSQRSENKLTRTVVEKQGMQEVYPSRRQSPILLGDCCANLVLSHYWLPKPRI